MRRLSFVSLILLAAATAVPQRALAQTLNSANSQAPAAPVSAPPASSAGPDESRSLFALTDRELFIGGRVTSIDGDPARFQRYQDVRDGILFSGLRYAFAPPEGAYTLRVRTSGVGTWNSWCVNVVGDPGNPRCHSPALALSAANPARDTITLASAGLGILPSSDVSISVNITHASSASVSVDLEALPTSGVQTEGAELFIRSAQAWQSETGNVAPSGTPAELLFSITDVAALNQMFSGINKTLNIAAAPLGVNGRQGPLAEVVTDYAEVTVRYRRP